MRTVVIGALGQLGRDLVPLLAGEVVPLSRADADLTKAKALREKLSALAPDTVINCAAYNFVDKAESDPSPAFAVNAEGVWNLATICRDLNCRLVHFSTDYVFGLDAKRFIPWSETDAPGPVSAYGLSKLDGEYWVRYLCPHHLVIRTCGLYGLHGTGGKGGNFVETMLKLAGQGEVLKVVHDQRCTPSFTLDVAAATVALLATDANGLFQITSAGDCSWYELAAEIFKLAGVSADLSPTTSEQYGAPARRPTYSVLSNQKLAAVGVNPPRDWHGALAAYLELRKNR